MERLAKKRREKESTGEQGGVEKKEGGSMELWKRRGRETKIESCRKGG